MNMYDTLVSFETAKLAKEKGFGNTEDYYNNNTNIPYYFKSKGLDLTTPMYNGEGELTNVNMPRVAISKQYLSAPTQSLLQK